MCCETDIHLYILDDRFSLLRSLKRSGRENGKKEKENYNNGLRASERLPVSPVGFTGTTSAGLHSVDRRATREDLRDLLRKQTPEGGGSRQGLRRVGGTRGRDLYCRISANPFRCRVSAVEALLW